MAIGRQAIMDIYDYKEIDIENLDLIKRLLFESAKESNLHIVDYKFHKFDPIGISGVLVLAESHLTIHTWPEYNYIAIDVFTCGNKINPVFACEVIAKNLCSDNYKIEYFERGNEDAISRIRN